MAANPFDTFDDVEEVEANPFDTFDKPAQPTVDATAAPAQQSASMSAEPVPADNYEPDTLGESLTKVVENTPERFQNIGGGLMQMAGDDKEAGMTIMQPYIDAQKEGREPGFADHLKSAYNTVTSGALNRLFFKQAAGDNSPAARFTDWLSEKGREISATAKQDLADNQAQPEGFMDEFITDVARGTIDMGPMLTAGFIAKNPNVAMMPFAAQVAGQTYADRIDKGVSETAAFDAVKFNMLAEVLPEKLPVDTLLKHGTPFVKRFINAALGEGVQETLTSVLQQAYDNKTLEGMSLKDAILNIDWQQAGYEGLVGSGVGASLSIPTSAADRLRGGGQKYDQAPGAPITPTHKVAGGIDAQPVTKNGKPVPDTFIDATGKVHRDPTAVEQPITAPVDINGESLDVETNMESIKAEVMGDTSAPNAAGGIVNSIMSASTPESASEVISQIKEQVQRDDIMGTKSADEVIDIDIDGAPVYDDSFADATRDIEKPIDTVSDISEPVISESETQTDLTLTDEQQIAEPIGIDEDGAPIYADLAPSDAESGPEYAPVDSGLDIEVAAHEASTSQKNDLTEPTEAQKEAGNYKKGHTKVQGLDIAIENPAGSKRNPAWPTMKQHYGYIKRTVGADSEPGAAPHEVEQVDVFIKPDVDIKDSNPVFIVDQYIDGKFDEHKVMMGFDSLAEATEAYNSNYTKDWKGLENITEASPQQFKEWLASGDTITDYRKKRPAIDMPKGFDKPAIDALVADNWDIDYWDAKDIPGATESQYVMVHPDDEHGDNPVFISDITQEGMDYADAQMKAADTRQSDEDFTPEPDVEVEADTAAFFAKQREELMAAMDETVPVARGIFNKLFKKFNDFSYERTNNKVHSFSTLPDGRKIIIDRKITQDPSVPDGLTAYTITPVDEYKGAAPAIQRETASNKPGYIIKTKAGDFVLDKQLFISQTPKTEKEQALSDKSKGTAVKSVPVDIEGNIFLSEKWNNLPDHVKSDWSKQAGLTSKEIKTVLGKNWGNIENVDIKSKIAAVLVDKHKQHQQINPRLKDAPTIIDIAKDMGKLEVIHVGDKKPTTELVETGSKSVVAEKPTKAASTPDVVAEIDLYQDFLGTGMQAANRKRTLDRESMINGKSQIRKEFIEQQVADGFFIGMDNGKRILENGREFTNELNITKTGMDYAEHLLVNRGTLPEKTGSDTIEPVYSGTGKDNEDVLRVSEESTARWSEVLPGLSRSQYAELSAEAPGIDPGAAPASELQSIRQHLQETGATIAGALQGVWGRELADAPRGLQQAADSNVAVPGVPSGTTQTGQRGDNIQDAGGEVRARIARTGQSKTSEINTVTNELYAGQAGWDLDKHYSVATDNQLDLNQLGEQIQDSEGVKYIFTPEQYSETAAGEKKRSSAERKLKLKYHGNGSRLTDIVRGTFIVDTPLEAEAVIDQLAKHFDGIDEGWSRTPLGYIDRKVLIQFDNKQVAEIQLVTQEVHDAKDVGGHEKYEEWRELVVNINGKMRAKPGSELEAGILASDIKGIYAEAMAKSNPAWKPVYDALISETQSSNSGSGTTAPLVETSINKSDSTQVPPSSAAQPTPSESLNNTNGRLSQRTPLTTVPNGKSITNTSKESIAQEDQKGVTYNYELPTDTDNQKPDTRTEPGASEADGELGADGTDTGRVRSSDNNGQGTRSDGVQKEPSKRTDGTTDTGSGARSKGGRGSGSVADNGRANVPVLTGNNYRITDTDQLGKGSAMEKARANLAAIRITKQLKDERRNATKAEQAELVKYVGWGDTAIKNKLFPSKAEPTGAWKQLHDELRELLTEEELKTASRSVQYAHYTSKPIIDGIYEAIAGFGLKSGLAIEGGAGTGHFLGLMPENMNVHYTGVEMDIVSGNIGKALYPDSGMITGDFTRIGLPSNHFDLSIGNPPFANMVVKNDPKYRSNKFLLHDYFIAKQIDSVKPGGIAVFVTSKGTMNKVDDEARTYLSEQANLLGAIRLPQTAFKETAGTEVVTDILFFQKKGEGIDDNGVSWADVQEFSIDGEKVNNNEYFITHPEMILGKQAMTSGQFGPEYTVEPTGDIAEQIKEAVARLPKEIYTDHLTPEQLETKRGEFDIAPEDTEASFYIDKNNNIRQVLDGVGTVVTVRGGGQRTGKSKAQAQQIRDYIPLRDAVMATYKEMSIEGDIKGAQYKLVRAYNAFVKAHGPINQVRTINRKDGKVITTNPIIATIDEDPEAYRVAGIELYDEARNKGEKGDIFTKNIISRFKEVNIESAVDALNVTLNDRGYVDVDYLIGKYPGTKEDILAELDTAIFQDPDSGRYLTEDDYLSGDVKYKLQAAQIALEDDTSYRKNVAALEEVQPENLDLARIPTNIGNHWMEPWIMESFAKELMGFSGTINHFIQGDTSRWVVNGTAKSGEYSTQKRKAVDMLAAALNSSTIKVYNYFMVEGSRKQELDTIETAAANQKVQEIKDKFKVWAKQDPDAAEYIYRVYNEKFNSNVPRKFNGDHLALPGLAKKFQPKIVDGERRSGLHQWVRDSVWRILQRGNMYMAHTVGAGKTLASITAGMELRRLGLAKKPTYAVLKSTLKQFAAEFYEAYPNARVLIADEKQLDKKHRRRFMARMANEEWDAIIMTHQTFQNIQLSPDFVNEMVEGDLEEYRALLEEIDSEDRATRSQIERMIESMENKLVAQSDQASKDAGLTFEELGIDFLFIDEAHTHKKIPFPTAQTSIKGVDANGSAIAYDLYLKSRYLNTVKPGRNLVLMSGTPVTNTLGEAFNIQRYLQPKVLADKSISSFDAWSATFAETVTDIEMQPNGKYKPVTRMSKFVGVPGLLRDFLQVADIVSNDDLNQSLTIKRPDVVGGARQIKVAERSPELEAYQQTLDARIKKLEQKKGPPKKGDDNILVVITDGKKSAIDMRMVGIKQTGESKLDMMIGEVYDFWLDTKDVVYTNRGKKEPKTGSTQLIFTEIRLAAGFDIYEHIKDTLVARGVPAREIAYIQDYNNSNKKAKLFKEMNTGVKRILLGGSKNLGTGTNVQQRLGKISHLDIDYVPANITQREGRGIRQGNKNDEIRIDAYATEGTVDSTMWQMNERKQSMIDQVMSGDLSIDSVEDISNEVSQMAMAKALSSGNPLLLEQAGIEADVSKLQALSDAHVNKLLSVNREIKGLTKSKLKAREALPGIAKLASKYKSTAADKFTMMVSGKKFTDRKKAGNALIADVEKGFADIKDSGLEIDIASIAGYDVKLINAFGSPKLVFKNVPMMYDAFARMVYNPTMWVEADVNAVGIIRKLENSAKAITVVDKDINVTINVVDRKLEDLNNQATGKFQYGGELEQKRQRLKEINQELEDEGKDAPVATVETTETEQTDDAPLFSANSQIKNKPLVSIPRANLDAVVNQFRAQYKGAAAVNIIVRDTQGAAFGINSVGEHGRIKGGFTPGTNDIVLIAENIKNNRDAMATLYHEIVAHYGLRQLLNKDGEYDALLDRVDAARDGELAGLYQEVEKAYPALDDKHKLADEVLARAAETKSNPGFFEKIYAQLIKLLQKFGLLSGPVSRREVNALLELSAQNLRRDFNPVTDKTDEMMYRRADDDTPVGNSLGLPEETYKQFAVRFLQNGFNRLDQLQKEIIKRGGNIVSDSDVYQAEELSSGRTTARLVALDNDHMKPLVDQMDRDNITIEELDEFLMAKHAPERNDYIASVNEDMQDGGSGMTYMEADAVIARFEDKRDAMEEAAERVYAVNRKHLNDLVAAGHIDHETVAEWAERWQFYVPLKGIVEEDAIGGQARGQGYSVRGSGVKAAMGRGAGNLAESPTAHAFAQAESTIVRAEKTKIGQALVNLVRANPDPAFWTINKRTLQRFTDLYGEPFEGYDEIPDGMVEGLDMHRVMHVTKAERKAAKQEGRNPIAKVAYKMDMAYKQRDDVFAVMIEGQELSIQIKDQIVIEQLKRMNASQFSWLVANAGKVNRYLATVNTALNPEFVITNFERDIQTALIHLSGEQTTAMAKKVLKTVPGAARGIWQATFDTAGNSPWRAEYVEMQKEGGTIGFFGLEDIETKVKRVQDRLQTRHTAFGKGKKAVFTMRDLILDANLAVENSTRLAAYVASRDSWIANGMPAAEARKKAASLAKNLTVNFNRKGEAGPVINSFYLFFNASIQGSARMLSSLLTSKRTRQIVTGMMVMGFMQAMFNRGFGGDDDDDIPKWDKISDYTKQTHMIFMLDGMDLPVKFKMPYGYNIFHYTGTALHDLIFDDKKTAMGTAMSMLSAVMNSWNPLQGADVLDTITPTALKPWEQSERNMNFMGAPIKPEYPFDQYDRPESQKYWKSTNAGLKEVMRILNEATGGDETHPGAIDISPETMNHYVKWLFGGAGATVTRTTSSLSNLAAGEPIDIRNVPFVRTAVVPQSSYYDKQRFYESIKQVSAIQAQLKLYKGTENYSDYKSENSEVNKLAFHVTRYKNTVKRLNDKRDKAYADDDTDLANEYREEIRQVMMQFSKRYDDAVSAQE